MKKSYFIFVVLCLGFLLLGVVFAGTRISLFLNIPALIVVIFPPSFIVIAVYGLSPFFNSFRLAFQGTHATVEELKTGVALFRTLTISVLLIGFITMMIGLIAILGNPVGADELGKLFAIALITLFYSLILIFLVIIPFKAAFEKRIVEKRTEEAA